tara:strand:+ start:17208 stop:18620 length:1413 start_codon:yes stop_codon:yes gene_type:complete
MPNIKPIDVSISTVTVATSKGSKTYYSMDVVDPNTGKTLSSKNTTNLKQAETYYNQQKQKYPNSTTNSEVGKDPFKDGDFKKQTDIEFGGFEKKDDVLESFGITPLVDAGVTEKDLRDFSQNVTAGARASQATSNLRKKSVDLCGLAEKRKEQYKKMSEKDKCKNKISGGFGTKRMQAMCSRETLPSEVVVGRGVDNNAFIVIGNDRVGRAHTGWGGKAHTQCDAIDLVAGLGGWCPRETEKVQIESENGTRKTLERAISTNPDPYIDAARVYISQKTDVDKNFGIGEEFSSKFEDKEDKNIGKYGAKSAVVTKADNIRIIGRESIRIVTGTDRFNSTGGEIHGKSGIELVAMNKVEDLQPIVLGDNLQLALITVLDNIEALAKILHGYMKYQMKYNQALQKHTHVTPFYGIETLLSKEAMISGIQCDVETASRSELSLLKHITNLQGVKHNFLIDSGESFINSRNNKSN